MHFKLSVTRRTFSNKLIRHLIKISLAESILYQQLLFWPLATDNDSRDWSSHCSSQACSRRLV